nr:MAG TPA: hypothetical protein [Caudoviricetes sp.]
MRLPCYPCMCYNIISSIGLASKNYFVIFVIYA